MLCDSFELQIIIECVYLSFIFNHFNPQKGNAYSDFPLVFKYNMKYYHIYHVYILEGINS